MQVFGATLSPFVWKVHVAAAEKGLEFESVPASPFAPSAEFAAASPFRKIPALKDGDFTLSDSTAIITYFDGLKPEPAIAPGDAKARAKAIWFEEFADTIMMAAGGKVVFNRFVSPKFLGKPGDEAVAEQGVAELGPIFDYLESVAPADGWLAGAGFSVGDIAIASCCRTLGVVGLAPDAAKHPQLAAWFDRVQARPAWQAALAKVA
jgi:glutathione S-transferase